MSGKVTVKITARNEFSVFKAGRQIGQGSFTAQGSGTYGHGDSAGWGFSTKGAPTAENIAAALTDNTNSFYIIE
jgi:hypothetical protein